MMTGLTYFKCRECLYDDTVVSFIDQIASPTEQQIVKHVGSSYVLGRSGTG